MVQLKEEFKRRNSRHQDISIPHGTIKRIISQEDYQGILSFQYLMVQLKVMLLSLLITISVFQYLMVQLKVFAAS